LAFFFSTRTHPVRAWFNRWEAEDVKGLAVRRGRGLKPSIDEPDADLIWEAEQAAQRVSTLAAQPDVKHFFERRLERYSQELLVSAARLTQKTYRVVFSGAIAAGKSTVICRVEGLEIPGDKAMPTNGTPTVRDAIWARPQVSSPDFRSAPYAGSGDIKDASSIFATPNFVGPPRRRKGVQGEVPKAAETSPTATARADIG